MNIVVVQLEPMHAEVVLPVVWQLHSHASVRLVANASFRGTLPLPPTVSVDWIDWPSRRGLRTALAYLRGLLRLNAALRAAPTNALLFVTIPTPAKAWLVSRCFSRHHRLCQIIHNGQRYRPESASHRRTLSRFAVSLFLSGTLARNFAARFPDLGSRIDSFWATGFPTDPAAPSPDPAPDAPLRLVIPGSVNQSRRDYLGLLAALGEVPAQDLLARVRFVLAGRTPASFQQQIQESGLAGLFETSSEFLSFSRLFATVQQADAVFFLVNKSVSFFAHYGILKQSGSENLALAFARPVIVASSIPLDEPLAQVAWRHHDHTFVPLLQQILTGELSRESIRTLAHQVPGERWQALRADGEGRLFKAVAGQGAA